MAGPLCITHLVLCAMEGNNKPFPSSSNVIQYMLGILARVKPVRTDPSL